MKSLQSPQELPPVPSQDPSAKPSSAVIYAASVMSTVWPGRQDLVVKPCTKGLGGMESFSVSLDGQAWHLKLSPADRPVPPARLQAEIGRARKAAAIGVAPGVKWSSEAQQALLTDFIVNHATDQVARPVSCPVVAATASVLARAHTELEGGGAMPFPAAKERDNLYRWMRRAEQSPLVPGPLALQDLQGWADQLITQLSQRPYRQTFCHGDMNGLNSIYDGQRAWLIDWESSRIDDPMFELAYYAFHIDAGIDDMAVLASIYAASGTMADGDTERLHEQLALLHVIRYCMRVEGQVWDQPKSRDIDLKRLSLKIGEDMRLLGDKQLSAEQAAA